MSRVSTDGDILLSIRRAFASSKRPRHFATYKHCEECWEHDELLRSRDLDSLAITDVGDPCWNPIPSTTPAGFCYYFPALARLSLDEPDRFHGWYFRQLLFFLTYRGAENAHLHYFSADQRQTVVAFLCHVAATRQLLIEDFHCQADLQKALELWTPKA